MKKYIFISIILIGFMSTGTWVYNQKQSKTQSNQNSYRVITTQKSKFKKAIQVDGEVQARDSNLVYADQKLKVDEVIYKEGDFVEQGEIIITFDSEDKNKLTRELKKEKIKLRRLQRDLDNAKELHEAGGMSKVDKENIEFDIETSLLNIEDYEEELDKMLDYIVSPYHGTILDMVAAENYRVDTDKPLFEMADLSDIIIIANVPEYDIDGVVLGQDAVIKLDAYEGKEFKGKVIKISTLSVNEKSEAQVEVEIAILDIPDTIRPGFNSKVDIIISSNDNAITIPRTTILEEKNKEFIFLLDDDNIAKKQIIEINNTTGNLVEVTNLKKGQRIILDPNKSIEDGDKIIVGLEIENDNNSPNKGKGRGKNRGES